MEDFKFELGQDAEDVITGFKGVIIGRTQYLTQCNCYGIVPRGLTKEGKRFDCEWFDEPRIKAGKNKLTLIEPERKKTGGPSHSSEYAPIN